MFATNQNTTYNSLNVPVNTSKQDCDKWVYDKSTFESTFITKVQHFHRLKAISNEFKKKTHTKNCKIMLFPLSYGRFLKEL
jgi:hypothetical protein